MTLVSEDFTTTYSLHGVTFTSYVSSATGAAELASWRAEFAPQTPGQPHAMTREEVVYVLAGELVIAVDDHTFTASAGKAVLVPAGAMFCVTNATDAPAQAWVTSSIGMRATLAAGEEIAPPWAQ